jgi:ATP-dependent DNA helicase RecQ
MIVDILRGKNSEQIRARGFDGLSTYGIMASNDQRRIHFILDHLIKEGYLRIEGQIYPVLRLGPRFREVIAPDAVIKMCLPEKFTAPAESSRIESPAASKPPRQKAPPDDTPVDEDRFQSLRELRTRFASEQSVPPFFIFSDAVLKELCRKAPKTNTEFLAIKGIGESKLTNYGEPFMAIIRRWE